MTMRDLDARAPIRRRAHSRFGRDRLRKREEWLTLRGVPGRCADLSGGTRG
jgi:hypothetical protein